MNKRQFRRPEDDQYMEVMDRQTEWWSWCLWRCSPAVKKRNFHTMDLLFQVLRLFVVYAKAKHRFLFFIRYQQLEMQRRVKQYQREFFLTQKILNECTVQCVQSNLTVVLLSYWQTEFRKCSQPSNWAIFSGHPVCTT